MGLPTSPKMLLVSAPHHFGWPWGRGNVYRGFYEYLGTGYLAAACMERGIKVDILDAPFHGWGPQRTAQEVKKRDFDVLGISANWQEFFPQAAALLQDLASLCDAGKPIILGGHFPTIAYEGLMADFPSLTAICRGEGERTLVEAMEAIGRSEDLTKVPGLAVRDPSGKVVTTAPRPMIEDLDSLPFPVRPQSEMYRAEKNPGQATANILTSRGCGGSCTFCTIHAFQRANPGPKWRARSPENVVDEIEKVQKDFGFTKFRFVDEDFFGRCVDGRDRAQKIAGEIRRRKLDADLELYCRADEVDPDILRVLKEAGLRTVYLSLDAVSSNDIALYSKGTTPRQMAKAVRDVFDSGIKLSYSFIFWHPYRKLSELGEAFSLLDEAAGGDPKVYSEILKGLETGIISDLVVLTGSPLEEKIRKDGLLRGNYRQYSYGFVHPSTAAAYKLVKAYKWARLTAQNLSNSLNRPHFGSP